MAIPWDHLAAPYEPYWQALVHNSSSQHSPNLNSEHYINIITSTLSSAPVISTVHMLGQAAAACGPDSIDTRPCSWISKVQSHRHRSNMLHGNKLIESG
eukprot:364198-Chlamydomonas_euryale.AAC.17